MKSGHSKTFPTGNCPLLYTPLRCKIEYHYQHKIVGIKVKTNTVKGHLIAIGGAENKGDKTAQKEQHINHFEMGVLGCLSDLLSKEDPRIEVITTASQVPDEMADMYGSAFEKLGRTNIGHLKITDRHDTNDAGFLRRIEECDCVLFTGGDQLRLTTVFGGTTMLSILKDRYQNDCFAVAGSSAGAMALSTVMINGGDAKKAHLKGEIDLCPGLGFFENAIIDTHFDKRGRFFRLVQSVMLQPGIAGVGLAEDTGIITSGGTTFKTIGSSIVTIVNGHHIGFNNVADIACGEPISAENIVVHILSRSGKFDFQKMQLIAETQPANESFH